MNSVLNDNGCFELFSRGLKTRVAINAVQSMLFTVLWKNFGRSGLEDAEKNYIRAGRKMT